MSLQKLSTFDEEVYNYIYKYPGRTVWSIQQDIDFRKKHMIAQSLKYLARRGLISNIDSKIYPICSQVLA